MVSVIGFAVLFAVIAGLCSMAFSRYVVYCKRQQMRRASAAANNTTCPDVAESGEANMTHIMDANESATGPSPGPETCMREIESNTGRRTHRRSAHLISYSADAGGPNGFTWKQFFLPARHIAYRHRPPVMGDGVADAEYAAGAGSLSVSPSQPVVFGGGREEKEGSEGASMQVTLTPPSPVKGGFFSAPTTEKGADDSDTVLNDSDILAGISNMDWGDLVSQSRDRNGSDEEDGGDKRLGRES